MQLPFYQIIGGMGCDENNFVSPQIIVSMVDQKYSQLRNAPNEMAINRIEFVMDEDAGIADFVAQGAIPATGLLVSAKAYDTMRKFNMQPALEEYEVLIDHNDFSYNYRWLNPVFDYFTLVDFQKTNFYLLNLQTGEKKDKVVHDFNDFFTKVNLMKGLTTLTADTFNVKDIAPFSNLDLLLFSFSGNMLVSPKLKDAIERANLSAVMFDEEPVIIQQ